MLNTKYFYSNEEFFNWMSSKFEITRLPDATRFWSGTIWNWTFTDVQFPEDLPTSIVVNWSDEDRFLRVGSTVPLTEHNRYGLLTASDVRYQFGSIIYMETTDDEFIALVAPSSGWQVFSNTSERSSSQGIPFFTMEDYTNAYVGGCSNIILANSTIQLKGNKIPLMPYYIGVCRMKNLYTSPILTQIGNISGNYVCIARGLYYKFK